MNSRRARLAAVVAISFAGALAGCGGLPSTSEAPQSGGPPPPPTITHPSSASVLPASPSADNSSVDSSDGDGQLDQTGAAASSANESGQVNYAATTQYAVDIIGNADRVWSAWFVSQGYPVPFVTYKMIQPGESYVLKPCTPDAGMPSTFPNAFYCDVSNGTDNGVILIPIDTLAKMWSGDIFGTKVGDVKAVGDYAAGVILSHEFGHSVGAELAEATGKAPMARGKNKELLADCFAGVHTYALSLGTDGSLDAGDVDEALNALAAIGDKGEGGPDPHGSPLERKNAFQIGLYGTQINPVPGVPANCTRTFWPELGL